MRGTVEKQRWGPNRARWNFAKSGSAMRIADQKLPDLASICNRHLTSSQSLGQPVHLCTQARGSGIGTLGRTLHHVTEEKKSKDQKGISPKKEAKLSRGWMVFRIMT